MNTKYDFKQLEDERLVYIRPVTVAELPDEMRKQVGSREHVFGVHTPDGARLALVKDRKLAFALARQNDFAPVNVH